MGLLRGLKKRGGENTVILKLSLKLKEKMKATTTPREIRRSIKIREELLESPFLNQ